MSDRSSLDLHDFSLVKGGPFYGFLIRLRLLKPDSHAVHRMAIFLALLAWLPLLLLSAFQGLALGGPFRIPFLFDFPVSVRFLLVIPLLVVAESVVDSRVGLVVRYLTQSGLVHEKDYPRYHSAVCQVSRMCNSRVAEGVIVGLVILGAVFWRLEFSGVSSTWQFLVSPLGTMRTPAGWWYVFVSIPIFRFLLYRWLWRYFLWCWFLWRISRLDLQLIPTHPDLAAGLGCLGLAQTKFGIIIFALSSLLSAHMGEEILFGGALLAGYRTTILVYIFLILVIFLGPLLFLSPRLFEVKKRGLMDYGALANQYTRSFDRKWIRKEAAEGDALLGSNDIQSLVGLRDSFEIIRRMRAFPFDLMTTVIPLVACAAIPFAPLILTVFPFEEIIKKILKIWF
jgi:hypothetical protein